MDPDAAREHMIEVSNNIIALYGPNQDDHIDAVLSDLAVELAEAVHDLDEWLRKGGFFPAKWTEPNPRRAQDGRLHDVRTPLSSSCGFMVWSAAHHSTVPCLLDLGHSGYHVPD